MKSKDEESIDPALLEAELARPLETELLLGPAVLEPPSGFAARVLAARTGAIAVAPTSRRWVARVALTAAAAAAVAFFVGPRLVGGNSTGSAAPTARESIALGERGIAVAEAGAQLAWKLKHGSAEIEQGAGEVFYRVERGGPFRVHTPAGVIEVHGTCFSVEVRDMKIGKQGMMGAGVGAALVATVVIVGVYEGKVSFANEHGQVALAAGERARASSGGGAPSTLARGAAAVEATPSGPAAATLSREELVARAEAQAKEIVALRTRMSAVEGTEGGGSAARKNDERENYLNPSKEDLEKLASKCRLQWDEPKLGLNPQTLDAEHASEMGLSDGERVAMNKLNADFNGKITVELRQLYVELTGDSAGADALTPGSLIEELEEKSVRPDVQAAYQRIAREKAGLQAAPADLRGTAPIDRLMRLRSSLGDRYEKELGAAIGPDLAHQLREKNGGWGSRHGSSYGCPDGK